MNSSRGCFCLSTHTHVFHQTPVASCWKYSQVGGHVCHIFPQNYLCIFKQAAENLASRTHILRSPALTHVKWVKDLTNSTQLLLHLASPNGVSIARNQRARETDSPHS